MSTKQHKSTFHDLPPPCCNLSIHVPLTLCRFCYLQPVEAPIFSVVRSSSVRPRRRELHSLAHLSHLFPGKRVLNPEVELMVQKLLWLSTTVLPQPHRAHNVHKASNWRWLLPTWSCPFPIETMVPEETEIQISLLQTHTVSDLAKTWPQCSLCCTDERCGD